ncbi:MAG: hypothetical protein LBL49_00785 [Clostridiales Family XIII bacterium]|jgi:hypothetical protein|nr:hypothetical protein [Clostridiales Family XIII bacterium]
MLRKEHVNDFHQRHKDRDSMSMSRWGRNKASLDGIEVPHLFDRRNCLERHFRMYDKSMEPIEPSKPVFTEYCLNSITLFGIVALSAFAAIKVVIFLMIFFVEIVEFSLSFGILSILIILPVGLLSLVIALLYFTSCIWLPGIAYGVYSGVANELESEGYIALGIVSGVLIILYGATCALYEIIWNLSMLMRNLPNEDTYICWSPIASGIVLLIGILTGLPDLIAAQSAYPKLRADYEDAKAKWDAERKAEEAEWERTRPERERREAIARAERKRREAESAQRERAREEIKKKLDTGECPKCGGKICIEHTTSGDRCHYIDYGGSNSNCGSCHGEPCVGHVTKWQCSDCSFMRIESVAPPY